jgi:sugar phosphate isomerase/epimerase
VLALLGASIMHTNMVADLRIARETGYDGIEIWAPKLDRYLEAGHSLEELVPALGSLFPAMISPFEAVESDDPRVRREVRRRCESLCARAQVLHCPAVQVILLDDVGASWPEMRTRLTGSLAELADIALRFEVSLAVEPVSFYPGDDPPKHLPSLAHTLEIVDAAGRDNVGLVIDLFHLWAGGNTWREVADLDAGQILGVHIGDGTEPRGPGWTENDRAALPGEGIAPLNEGVAAVRETGYDRVWSVEVFNPYLWERDPVQMAREMKRCAEALLAG